MKLSRRTLLNTFCHLAVLSTLRISVAKAADAIEYPFTLGVASGDPWPDGFVLWTRLAPKPLEIGSGLSDAIYSVSWEVASDESFQEIVRSGVAEAHPDLGHSVHIELFDLQPSRRYWYRFRHGQFESTVGTVRTAPRTMAEVDQLRIGVAGCQNYEHGLFTAYRYLSQEKDLDAIFHYGDYIYEGPEGRVTSFRNRNGERVIIPTVRPHLGPEITRLEDYRLRYAQYKNDEDLQAAHAAAAFLITYDDHEVDNNWAGSHDENGTNPEQFLTRRYAAMQAWYENMPVRQEQMIKDGVEQMYRRLDYGRLLRIHLMDTRQYRDDQICDNPGDKNCRNQSELDKGSILGQHQHAWLDEGLDSHFHWNLIAQQVVVSPFDLRENAEDEEAFSHDSWSGYPQSRRQLVATIQEKKLSNIIISTGDVHQNIVAQLPARDEELDKNPVAAEFVCTSISSLGDGQDLKIRGPDFSKVLAHSPHMLFANGHRGYQVFTINSKLWRTDIMKVDKITDRSGRLSLLQSFTVESGSPTIHRS